jgi:heme/copper-type cytochrome/quinol oxidase subunit 3
MATSDAEIQLEARNASTVARLIVAADAFLWMGFVFAYFYLRTLNSNGDFNPPGQNPSGTMGTISLVVALLAVAAVAVAGTRIAAGGSTAYRGPAAIGLLLLVVFLVLQGIQLFDPGFSPANGGGFGAVFVGFTAAYFVHLFGGLYWLETLVVQRGGPTASQASSFALVWYFLVAVFAIFWLLFYVVA